MENPIKAATNLPLILKTAVLVFVIFALAELTGLNVWLTQPIASFKERFGK